MTKTEQLAIRFTPDELARLKETAAQERRSVSDTIRLILSDALAARRGGRHQRAAT